ncbi:MAG: hypothetical protein LBP53_04510 [Candidatus Peribacteria bacterium]|jgi:spore photoproduct lyase|nr:hypothetical protein [Candidatus Peribacteria bacterium]
MLLYIETKAKSYPLTQTLIQQFSQREVIEIQHYKNLFDKTISYPTLPALMIAKQEPIAILPTPAHYGYPGKSFFFKPSLNCVFDCSYCYLKGTFKNAFPVIFVNDEDIQTALGQHICKLREEGYTGQITFYASNYTDVLAIDHWTHFCERFFPFFAHYENVLLEVRTKSANIEGLKQLAMEQMRREAGKEVGKHVEIAFSLSPESLAQAYEPFTAPLQKKLEAIEELLQLGYRVGLRFLPLLPVEQYEKVYGTLIEQVKKAVTIEQIASIFIAPLIYNARDLAVMKKKYAVAGKEAFPFWEGLQADEQGLMKMSASHYECFAQLFRAGFP